MKSLCLAYPTDVISDDGKTHLQTNKTKRAQSKFKGNHVFFLFSMAGMKKAALYYHKYGVIPRNTGYPWMYFRLSRCYCQTHKKLLH